MEMVVSLVLPALTPAGSVPKVSFTDSPSSSIVSATAANVKVLEVSPLLKATLAGHAGVVGVWWPRPGSSW